MDKQEIEEWLVKFLTDPQNPLRCTNYGGYCCLQSKQVGEGTIINSNIRLKAISFTYFSKKPVKIYYIHYNEMVKIELESLPKRALMLLAIINRPAYEFYKFYIQHKV